MQLIFSFAARILLCLTYYSSVGIGEWQLQTLLHGDHGHPDIRGYIRIRTDNGYEILSTKGYENKNSYP
uniref:Secreted protein n=1 Tax=Globodera pallida TaxID=36090 RepID=A0A183BMA8_GLOPA